ncbi:MAG: aspartate aminotransferase, partial [Pseudomonadota bacterium]
MFQSQSPFERLRGLLAGITPGAEPIDLTVGSPRHAPPACVAAVIAQNAAGLMGYPPIDGTKNF